MNLLKIKKLIKQANNYDMSGNYKAADKIDRYILKLAEPTTPSQTAKDIERSSSQTPIKGPQTSGVTGKDVSTPTPTSPGSVGVPQQPGSIAAPQGNQKDIKDRIVAALLKKADAFNTQELAKEKYLENKDWFRELIKFTYPTAPSNAKSYLDKFSSSERQKLTFKGGKLHAKRRSYISQHSKKFPEQAKARNLKVQQMMSGRSQTAGVPSSSQQTYDIGWATIDKINFSDIDKGVLSVSGKWKFKDPDKDGRPSRFDIGDRFTYTRRNLDALNITLAALTRKAPTAENSNYNKNYNDLYNVYKVYLKDGDKLEDLLSVSAS